MAIKISVDGKISKILPGANKYFSISAMEELVGGWPYPIKVGPVWVIQNEDLIKTGQSINNLASRFFRTNIFGDVLTLSSHELPTDWDLLDDNDKKYTAEEIDAGFIKALTEMTIYEGYQYPINTPIVQAEKSPEQIEYTYSPEKQKVFNDEFRDFLKNAFDHVVSNKKEFVVYEDANNIVKVKGKKDQLKTLEQMLNIFVEEENYEAAAQLRDLKLTIEMAEE
jgi:hypothetical protein